MKGLILAAGRGTRIQSVHGERPKCLIRLNEDGDTILDQQIENLFSAGVSNIGIVVGYEMEQILDHVRVRHHKFLRSNFSRTPDSRKRTTSIHCG
jgi:choline kinase